MKINIPVLKESMLCLDIRDSATPEIWNEISWFCNSDETDLSLLSDECLNFLKELWNATIFQTYSVITKDYNAINPFVSLN